MAREMKNSGIEWIGEIPREWDRIKSKYLLNISSGEYISKEEYADTGLYSIIGANGEIGRTDKINNHNYVVTTGRVGTIGTAHKVEKVWITDNVLILKPKKIDIDFLTLVIPNLDFKHMTAGTAMPLITATKISNQFLPYPPLAEQQKIADFLDSECAKIDDVISKTKATVEEYKKLKQSVITKAVTKGIRPNREMKDSGIEWIGEIPREWVILKAKYLFQEGEGALKIGPFGSALSGKTLSEGPYIIYNQAHLVSNDFSLSRHYISENTFNELLSYEVKPGDILFSMMGTIGKCRIMPVGYCRGIMDSHLLKARLNKYIDAKYFCYVYDKDNSAVGIGQLNYYSNGSIMSGLNSSIVKNIFIPLPSIPEQQEIADYLDKKCAEIDMLITKKEQLTAELESYKKSLIYEYVTGKKEVK